MPKLRPTAENKAAIVEAAEKVFAEYGFEGASVKEIAQLAEVSQGLLYHHFTSKKDLWRAVSQNTFSRFIAKAAKNQKKYEHLAPWPRLEQKLLFGLEYALANPRSLRLQAWQALGGVPRFSDDPTTAVLSADLQESQRVGQIRGDAPAEDLARYIVLAFRGWWAVQVEQKRQKGIQPFDDWWLAMVLAPIKENPQ